MFSDRHIVITGGSSGLGLELAHRLAAEGARLTLIARDRAKLDAAAAQLRGRHAGARVGVEQLDVRDEAAADACMRRLAEAHGGIDVLINSAGILREGRFGELSPQVFREVMEINYFGLLATTRAALPQLKASRGRVLNIASMAGLTGAFGYTAYCASKHALLGFSDALRYELAPEGVTVQVVCPAEFDSPMVDEIDKSRSAENRAQTHLIPKAPVDLIADATMDGLRAGRYMIVPGRRTRLMARILRCLPGLVRALGDRTIARVQRERGAH